MLRGAVDNVPGVVKPPTLSGVHAGAYRSLCAPSLTSYSLCSAQLPTRVGELVVDLLTDIRRQIDERRNDLRAAVQEHELLVAARDALGDASRAQPTGATTGGRRKSSRPGGRRRRARRGANRTAVLRALEKQPGASVGELAAATRIKASVLYALRRRLMEDGAIVERERDDGRKGYALSNSARS
jgi:hypothetical protein